MFRANELLVVVPRGEVAGALQAVRPGRKGGATRRLSGRALDSILITSAPCSASSFVTSAPAPTQQKSTTLMPLSAAFMFSRPRRGDGLGYLGRRELRTLGAELRKAIRRRRDPPCRSRRVVSHLGEERARLELRIGEHLCRAVHGRQRDAAALSLEVEVALAPLPRKRIEDGAEPCDRVGPLPEASDSQPSPQSSSAPGARPRRAIPATVSRRSRCRAGPRPC